jgi:hypothetical protein
MADAASSASSVSLSGTVRLFSRALMCAGLKLDCMALFRRGFRVYAVVLTAGGVFEKKNPPGSCPLTIFASVITPNAQYY